MLLSLSHRPSPVLPGEVVFGTQTRVCAENRLRWDLTPEQIHELSDELIAKTKQVYDTVGTLDLGKVTYENTLKALADVEVDYTGEQKVVLFNNLLSQNSDEPNCLHGFMTFCYAVHCHMAS